MTHLRRPDKVAQLWGGGGKGLIHVFCSHATPPPNLRIGAEYSVERVSFGERVEEESGAIACVRSLLATHTPKQ